MYNDEIENMYGVTQPFLLWWLTKFTLFWIGDSIMIRTKIM